MTCVSPRGGARVGAKNTVQAMALFLREDDVARVLRMEDIIAALEEAFRQHGLRKAVNRPRHRVTSAGTTLHVMSGAIPSQDVMGVKVYSSAKGGARFLGMLYCISTGELLAVMEADRLGQLRTGAASAVATKYLARPNAGTVGIIGTGWQARSQLIAISKVRPIALVQVYGRNMERRSAFADEMIGELGAEVSIADTAEEAVRGVDIIVTATNARDPVLQGAWVTSGVHINAIGSNWAQKREIDTEAVRRSHRIVVDDLEQAKIESGDLLGPIAEGVLDWTRVVELGQLVTGEIVGRTADEQITLFESQGIAMEDVATMKLAFDRARASGIGALFQTGDVARPR